MTYTSQLCCVALLVLVAGCAGPGASTPPPGEANSEGPTEERAQSSTITPVGAWAYEADSPQGTYSGTLSITETSEGELQGEVTPSDGSTGSPTVQEVAFEDETLTFDLVGGRYGPMEARVTVGRDRFEGTMRATRYDVTMPFTGERQRQ